MERVWSEAGAAAVFDDWAAVHWDNMNSRAKIYEFMKKSTSPPGSNIKIAILKNSHNHDFRLL